MYNIYTWNNRRKYRTNGIENIFEVIITKFFPMSVTNIKPWFQVAQTCVFNIQTIANQRQRKS